jgi:exosortase
MSDAAGIQDHPARTWGEFIPPVGRVQLLVVAALVLLVYWGPVRHDLIWKWNNDGNWSHGWLVPVFSLYLVWVHSDRLFATRVKPNLLGAVVVAASLTLYFASWSAGYSYPQPVSMVGVLLGLVLLLCGWQVLRQVWFPIVFLMFAIPLPTWLYVDLTMPLRQLASQVSAAVMPLFAKGLHTEAQAVVIEYIMPGRPPGTLNIEEACSGMRLMMSFVTLGVAMAYLGDRPTWQRLIMVVSCVPISVFCNAVRVTTTGLLYVHGLEDWARGTPHALLGICMLVLALGLYALEGYILSNLFVDEEQAGAEDTAAA